MADTLQFDLVSPERRLASVTAREVRIPATEGDMTAMAGHVPTITTLRPGVLQVVHASGTDEYVVLGGFAEVTATGVSVLAEMALPRAEVTSDVLSRFIDEARAGLARAQESSGGPVDEAAKLLADMVAVGDQIGIGARG